MAENKLGVGNISFPKPRNNSRYEVDLNIALEAFVRIVNDNIEYLLRPSISTITTTYTATDLDSTILADASSGAFTITLSSADSMTGKMLVIKKIDSSVNAVTVDGNGAEEIDGSATNVLSSQYDSIQIHSDGSNWYILSSN